MKRRMLFGSNFKLKLYGYYPFEDLIDHTINPSNLGSGFTSFVAGKLGNGIEFLNTGAAAARTLGDKFTFSNGVSDVPFSFSFWIYYKGGGSGNRFVFGRNSARASNASTNAEYQLYVSNTTNKITMLKYSLGSSANGKYITCDSTLSLNTWYHVAYTDNGLGDEKFYINGVLQSSAITYLGSGYVRMSITPNALTGFGNSLGVPGTVYCFLGILDDFGIFKDYILTQKDIDYIYNSGTGRTLK